VEANVFKLLGPIVVLTAWAYFAAKTRSPKLAASSLFFASFAAMSQNFTLVYREVHQVLQLFMIGAFFLIAIQKGSVAGFNKGLVLFFILAVTSIVTSSFDTDARIQLLNLLVSITVVNFLYQVVDSGERMKTLMDFVGTLALIEAVFGVVAFAIYPADRPEGTFANPNYFALFLGTGFCFVFQRPATLARNFSLLLLVAGIVVSGSRAVLAIPVLQCFWHLYRMRNGGVAFFYAAVGLIVIGSVVASGVTRFSDTDASQASDAERVIFAKIAYRMANDHPIFGVGWGRYVSEFGNYSSTAEEILTSAGAVDVSAQDRRVTHNDLVRILAELGWLVLFGVLGALNAGFRRALRFKNGFLPFVFPLWVGTIFFSLTHNNMNNALFWFVFVMPFHFGSDVLRHEKVLEASVRHA
jgi:hypothetical protein